MKYQLVPPHDHRQNIAEKAVQTFKDHSMAVLCRTDAKFPMQLWCRILRQAEHQLNLLRKSRVVPNISAFACLYGQHDYNANSSTPLGTAVEMYVTPANRKTYEAHTKTCFYVGNSWEHYRCHEIWIVDTRSVRVGETVFFKHRRKVAFSQKRTISTTIWSSKCTLIKLDAFRCDRTVGINTLWC